MQEPFISIVSPIYQAENIANRLVVAIEQAVSKITNDYEIILVEDGSSDNSWVVIKDIARLNPKVKALKLSRNFGQHYAITAGLDESKGQWVVVMDCDLQDHPNEIPNLLKTAEQTNAKIVLGQRIERSDLFLKIWFSKLFYSLLSYLSGTKWDSTVANFGLYHKSVVKSIGLLREPIRFFPSMVKWVGFKSVKMPVAHQARDVGSSNYSINKRIKLALDIILANSDKPLRIIVKFGFAVSLFSALVGIFYVIEYLNDQITVIGFTSLMISLWFIAGLIFMMFGITGLYIGKIFEAAKQRPIYIIEEKINGAE
jgi:polyisoprenyl-phosphate glycosyltransferase